MRAPDITADEATITHTIGGQLDLGEWTTMPDGTRQLLVPNRIINVCDPVDDNDVATKKYVDARAGSGSGTTPVDPQPLPGAKGDRGPPGLAGPLGPIGYTGPAGPAGIQGGAGPTGLNGAFAGRGDPGPPGPTGVPGTQGTQGTQGIQGSTGSVGPQGIQGSSGLLLYLNPSGDSLTDVSIADSFLMSTTNVNFTTRAFSYTIGAGETMPLTYFWNLRTSITQAQSSIPGGEVWTSSGRRGRAHVLGLPPEVLLEPQQLRVRGEGHLAQAVGVEVELVLGDVDQVLLHREQLFERAARYPSIDPDSCFPFPP
jgi:hypothetical protein